jgi:hypothetical protein
MIPFLVKSVWLRNICFSKAEMQLTAVLDGKAVIAPPREVQEVRNAIKAYEKLTKWRPTRGLITHFRLLFTAI